MDTKQSDSEYSEEEARERGDAVLRHMMNKPPQKHEPLKKRKAAERNPVAKDSGSSPLTIAQTMMLCALLRNWWTSRKGKTSTPSLRAL